MDDKKWWHESPKENNDKKPNIPEFPADKIPKFLLIALVVVILAMGVFTSVYTVNDQQKAVVTTFGAVTEVTDPGIHFKLPFGIQKAELVDVNVYRKIEIGYRTANDGSESTALVENESKMISGDYNIVNCDFFLEYKISDPVKYLYNSEKPDEILKSLAQSHIRNIISSYDVDMILTTGKGEIQSKIKESIMTELEVYDLGVVLTDIKLQDAEPPTAAVNQAFKDVETAKQERETAINLANAYSNEQMPKAQAEADRLRADAELSKQQRINEANAEVALFNAMYNEYTLNPDVTRKRMFYEMVEKVLPSAKVYIDSSEGGTQKLLPLENFNG